MPRVASLALRLTLLLTAVPVIHAAEIKISKTAYEGREQFSVKTKSCTWVFDIAGGGFSQLLDSEGRDWIGFSKTPLSEFPQSAAAGYRGIPNCVFVGPDKGAGHPGFDQCTSRLVGSNRIVTESKSGKWKWQWTFHEQYAEFEILSAGESPWWFLYEGPPGGDYSPDKNYWGTDAMPQTRKMPANEEQRFGSWQTLYIGRDGQSQLLAIHQLQKDELADTLWFLGSENGGAADSKDGMIVVGFGRGPGTRPLLSGAGHKFRVGFVTAPEPAHEAILESITRQLQLHAVERSK
ncbi:MAG: hypothetical protein Aurels2KO_44860 [Aureliella sp.]